jgi:hypothetical protein
MQIPTTDRRLNVGEVPRNKHKTEDHLVVFVANPVTIHSNNSFDIDTNLIEENKIYSFGFHNSSFRQVYKPTFIATAYC